MPSPRPNLATPIINEDADRILGRIILRHGLLTFLLLLATTVGMAFVNVPQSRLFPERRFLDTLSILIVLIPFFIGINRVFAARLRIGRELVAGRRWREAVAALDPFAGPTQRFLDTTGEAHYWLAQAYAGVGDRARAEKTRAFLQRHRKGVWADRARSETPARRAAAASPNQIKVSQIKASEKGASAVKSKRRKRF